MLQLDPWTIVAEILNFTVLGVVLYFLLFRPMMRRIREEEAERERLLEEREEQRQEAQRIREDLEERLDSAEERASEIVDEAREKAEAERSQLIEEAEQEVEQILLEAQEDAQTLRGRAMSDFHDEMLDAIMTLSGQVIRQVAPPEVHDKLVEDLNDRIWEMGRSEMQQVQTFRRSLGEREPTAHVSTAQPLSTEQQGQLARTLTALADQHVDVELANDPALVAGVRVRLGDIIIDNSIADRLDEMRDSISEDLEETTPNE